MAIELSGIGAVIGLMALLAYVVLYVMTLVRQAKKSEWVWFVLSLLFNPVWIIYWIVNWVK